MKQLSKILWGVALIAAGVIFALNAFGITDITIFFDGWWTLFIIIPCLIGIFSDKEKLGSIIGFLIGVVLLLCCQNVLSFDMIWKLALPTVIVIIGIKFILGAIFGEKGAKILKESRANGEIIQSASAVFSGKDLKFDGEVFSGAEFTAVFGGLKCDLTNAIIEKDCAISATCVFGGIDILLPDSVNIKITSNSIFGGVDDEKKRNTDSSAVTVYINATCLFGGIEIK